MQIGMIGLGRMGAAMVRRLMKGGHDCVVNARTASAVTELAAEGAVGTASLPALVSALKLPRTVWLMVPAGAVDALLDELLPLLATGDTVIDGGNSHYPDDIRRGAALQARGLHYLDVGTSGGVAGLQRGYCLMIGGETSEVQRLTPVFETLAPGVQAAPRTPGRSGQVSAAEQGFLHCGPVGAGHFVKMVHNGIEYGVMAAYAEGLNLLRAANVGAPRAGAAAEHNAETTPLRDPALYQYDMNLPDITELWRRGSVISSWLLDLTALALLKEPELAPYAGHIADSGEGRWTIQAAIDEGVPVPVLSAALFARFSSRGNADFANRTLSAMRHGFGGHVEVPVENVRPENVRPENTAPTPQRSER
jgi:6-phosphogluconate dehydrogenase